MKTSVIITGVDGFLGGKITKRILSDTDWSILGLTMNLELPKKMLEREDIPNTSRVVFMTNDEFFNPDTQINNVFGAVHLAFSRRIQPAKDIASSIDFSVAVFHRLAALNVDRIINMSSQGIYGNTMEIRSEKTAPAPENHYTMAKYASEKIFNDIMHDTSHHTNFRLDLVAQSQNIVKGLCKSAQEGKINLKGGRQVFSFIDGEDVANAVVAMLKTEGEWEEVYNVGWNQKRYTLVELAEIVANMAEKCGYKKPSIELIESDIDMWAGMDTSRFMKKTGWEPRVSLEETVKSVLLNHY